MSDHRPDDLRHDVTRQQAEDAVRTLLKWAGDDPAREGLLDTPKRVIGAYDEVFARNLGAQSALKLERGHNALWSAPKPGLLYAPPAR